MREEEKRMMEDDVVPIPDLVMGEDDLRGKGGEWGGREVRCWSAGTALCDVMSCCVKGVWSVLD